jgi:hypothetical protein
MRSPCCLYVHPTTVAKQRLCKHVSAVMNTRTNGRIVGRVVFCAVYALSKGSLWVCLPIPLLFLGYGSVNTFLRQRRFTEGVVFYAVRVTAEKSMRSVIPRTYCFVNTGDCSQAYNKPARSKLALDLETFKLI